MSDNTQYRYDNHVKSLPIGEVYERVTDTESGDYIEVGDLVTYDDELFRSDYEDRGVTQRLFVGRVQGIVDRDNGPELLTTMPIGRVDAFGCNRTNVRGEGILPDPQASVGKFMEQYLTRWLDSDEDVDYMTMEWGEGIGDDGEDYKRTWG